jgi:hypothetical protein
MFQERDQEILNSVNYEKLAADISRLSDRLEFGMSHTELRLTSREFKKLFTVFNKNTMRSFLSDSPLTFIKNPNSKGYRVYVERPCRHRVSSRWKELMGETDFEPNWVQP